MFDPVFNFSTALFYSGLISCLHIRCHCRPCGFPDKSWPPVEASDLGNGTRPLHQLKQWQTKLMALLSRVEPPSLAWPRQALVTTTGDFEPQQGRRCQLFTSSFNLHRGRPGGSNTSGDSSGGSGSGAPPEAPGDEPEPEQALEALQSFGSRWGGASQRPHRSCEEGRRYDPMV